ncbi:hypothetical protein TNCV_309871 [Trichonephila clavipes]|nr:hypothetical protein TNCV_309871 [Trichonephila clavipes]
MIVYDVEEAEFEPNPADEYVLPEYWRKHPVEYLRALTPTRFRKRVLWGQNGNSFQPTPEEEHVYVN